MALCTQSCDKYVALLSDINSRTGALQAALPWPDWAEDWERTSSDPDEKINTRGRALVEDCTLYNLCILNGPSLETASPGRFTSWQPAGQSVIDYAIVSQNLLPLVRKFHVELPTEDEDEDYSDHMRICITFDAKAFEYALLPPNTVKPQISVGENTLISSIKKLRMPKRPRMRHWNRSGDQFNVHHRQSTFMSKD
jgi:hypothetical protein